VKGRIALIFHVGVEDSGEVQFLDHEITDEMGRMPLGASTLSRIGIGLLSKTRPADLPVKVAES
jgi:hypothetical protein